MDVYISEEYVAQRRAERRAARHAAAAAAAMAARGGCEEKMARAGGNGGQNRWTAAWAEEGKRAGDGNASAIAAGGAAGRVEDVILCYFSA
ncbi:hypothetical protein ACP70R_019461 [Stipagrostis hirtigluma subsp. patula]